MEGVQGLGSVMTKGGRVALRLQHDADHLGQGSSTTRMRVLIARILA